LQQHLSKSANSLFNLQLQGSMTGFIANCVWINFSRTDPIKEPQGKNPAMREQVPV
jgi:hypothetical protein